MRNGSAGIRIVRRLVEVEDAKLCCWSKTCVVGKRNPIKRAIVNEMCCVCCNEKECNVDDLVQVVQTHAYGFHNARESSVAIFW